MSRRARPWVVVGGLAVALVVATVVWQSDDDASGRRAAPALPKVALVPPAVTLESLRGKPAVVNFWASWCEPCRKEAAHLQRLSEELRGRAAVVGINYTDELSGARKFIRQYGWTFPNLRDPEGLTGSEYRVVGLPITFVLDGDGRIARELRGPQTQATLEKAIRDAESS